jgi:hypothetical protein
VKPPAENSPKKGNRADAELARLWRNKRSTTELPPMLGPGMLAFFKQSVARRQTKLTHIAEAWQKLVPDLLSNHCALEAFSRGSLSVIVDSAPHLYELKQLLLAGLEQQLLLACGSAGLRKIVLKPGRWYDGEQGDKRVRF